MKKVEIRVLDQGVDMQGLVHLQERIWGYGKPPHDDPLPARILVAIAHSGGLVAAAFLGSSPIGFSVAWLGRDWPHGELYLYSQMVGVLNSHREQGVGGLLKRHQRDFAIKHGLREIRWTFDPLSIGNARFNLHRLGATISSFSSGHYGPLKSALEVGGPSDRLWARWHIQSHRVQSRLEDEEGSEKPAPEKVLLISPSSHDLQLTGSTEWDSKALPEFLLITAPDQLTRSRQTSLDAVTQWRQGAGVLFQTLFSQGYVVVDFLTDPGSTSGYLLRKAPLEEILGD